ncbi:MAG: type II toxin-antitoxin system VapB family antitoxin [bacterium]|nr:type II toxin-antitoxin system VapB family antitoxin [bacterium]MBU1918484.1 type II toxin-antitoxin system VapB family antitoxin [bacterium]
MAVANYDLPENILDMVRKISGVKTKREAIIIALKEYLRKNKIQKLIESQGKVSLNWTHKSLRAYRG